MSNKSIKSPYGIISVASNRAIFLIKLTSCLLCLLLIAGCQKPQAYDSQGHLVRIADFRGKWVLINYWATWCNACMAEISILNKLATAYSDKVVVLGVNYDHLDNSALAELREEYEVKYRFFSNFPMEKYGVEEIADIPVTFIINPEGNLVQTLHGAQTLEKFQSLLSLPPTKYFNG
jgi:thiol-disulfide isomerase/thioredoxin